MGINYGVFGGQNPVTELAPSKPKRRARLRGTKRPATSMGLPVVDPETDFASDPANPAGAFLTGAPTGPSLRDVTDPPDVTQGLGNDALTSQMQGNAPSQAEVRSTTPRTIEAGMREYDMKRFGHPTLGYGEDSDRKNFRLALQAHIDGGTDNDGKPIPASPDGLIPPGKWAQMEDTLKTKIGKGVIDSARGIADDASPDAGLSGGEALSKLAVDTADTAGDVFVKGGGAIAVAPFAETGASPEVQHLAEGAGQLAGSVMAPWTMVTAAGHGYADEGLAGAAKAVGQSFVPVSSIKDLFDTSKDWGTRSVGLLSIGAAALGGYHMLKGFRSGSEALGTMADQLESEGHHNEAQAVRETAKNAPQEVEQAFQKSQEAPNDQTVRPIQEEGAVPQSTEPGGPVDASVPEPGPAETPGPVGPEVPVGPQSQEPARTGELPAEEEGQKEPLSTRVDHAFIEDARKSEGLPAIDKQGRTWAQAAQEAIDSGKFDSAVEDAQKVVDDPRPLSDKEQAAMHLRLHERRQAMADAGERGDTDAQAQALADQDVIHQALYHGRSELGRGLGYGNSELTGEPTPENIRRKAISANLGNPLTDVQSGKIAEHEARLQAAEDALDEAHGKIADLQEKLKNFRGANPRGSRNRVFDQAKYEAAAARLKSNPKTTTKTGAALDVPQHIADLATVLGYHIEAGVRDFKSLYDIAKQHYADLDEPTFAQAMKAAMSEISGKPAESRAEAEARVQNQRTKDAANNYLKSIKAENEAKSKAFSYWAKNILSQPKNIKFSGSPLHWLLQHGAPAVLSGDLKSAAKGIGSTLTAVKSGEAAGLDPVRTNPFYDMAKAVNMPGLEGHGTDLFIETPIGQKVSGSKGYDLLTRGKQGFGAGLARLRMERFARTAAKYDAKGSLDVKNAGRVRDYQSDMTGHGSLGAFEKSADGLNMLLSSARKLSSRYRILTGQTLGKAIASNGKFDIKDPLTQEALKDHIVMGIVAGMMGKTAWDKRVDISGGLNSVHVLASKTLPALFGDVKDDKGKKVSAKDAIFRFLENHLSPQASGLLQGLDRKEAYPPYESTNVAKEAVKSVVPMPFEGVGKGQFLAGQVGARVIEPHASAPSKPHATSRAAGRAAPKRRLRSSKR